MIRADIKAIHNVSRPGEVPTTGDLIQLECVGGFVRRVDPVTRKVTAERQTFRLLGDPFGAIEPA